MITGGGIELLLEDLMVDYIRGVTENIGLRIKIPKSDPSYPAVGEGETQGPPAIHAGMLPKNQVGQIDINTIPVFPFVLCHILGGVDSLSIGDITSSSISTKIVVGVWDDNADYQGYRDALAVLRTIVRKFWWENTIGEEFQLDMNEGTTWRVYDTNEVSWPYFVAEAVICWKMRRPFADYESEGLDIAVDPAFSRQPKIPAGVPSQPQITLKPVYE